MRHVDRDLTAQDLSLKDHRVDILPPPLDEILCVLREGFDFGTHSMLAEIVMPKTLFVSLKKFFGLNSGGRCQYWR